MIELRFAELSRGEWYATERLCPDKLVLSEPITPRNSAVFFYFLISSCRGLLFFFFVFLGSGLSCCRPESLELNVLFGLNLWAYAGSFNSLSLSLSPIRRTIPYCSTILQVIKIDVFYYKTTSTWIPILKNYLNYAFILTNNPNKFVLIDNNVYHKCFLIKRDQKNFKFTIEEYKKRRKWKIWQKFTYYKLL